jgi:hypothetical protein
MAKLINKVDYIHISPDGNDGMKYMLLKDQFYWSKRYWKGIKAPSGFRWDGATGAKDLIKPSLFHDILCNNACWEDGTPLTNWQASQVLKDILSAEGYSVRAYTWRWATFLLGGWGIKKRSGWFFSWKTA